jgi:hypothetical protein
MIDFIQNESKKMMYKCCEKYAAKKNISIDDVQLILGLNDEGNTYTLCEKYVRKENYTIMQVLGVKIDFLGYSQLAPPFILKSLIKFAEKHGIEFEKVNVMCVPCKDEKGKNDIQLFVYNDTAYVETITFEELFSEDDFTLPQ